MIVREWKSEGLTFTVQGHIEGGGKDAFFEVDGVLLGDFDMTDFLAGAKSYGERGSQSLLSRIEAEIDAEMEREALAEASCI